MGREKKKTKPRNLLPKQKNKHKSQIHNYILFAQLNYAENYVSAVEILYV